MPVTSSPIVLESPRVSHPLRIGFVAEIAENYIAKGWSKLQTIEFDNKETVDSQVRVLESLGHTVDFIGNIEELVKRLAPGGESHWDLIWSISEGNTLHEGREAQVPGLLEAHNVPFAFSDAATMALVLNKAKTKVQTSSFRSLNLITVLSSSYFSIIAYPQLHSH
jgi:D-alanine-D-alanine ligase